MLVVTEPSANGEVHPATLAAVTFARQLCGQIGANWSLLSNMSEFEAEASEARQLGAMELLCCPNEAGLHPLAERYAPTVCRVAREQLFDYIVAAATSFGKDLLPRIAGVLEAAYVGDCSGLRHAGSEVRFLRPVYAGVAIAECEVLSGNVVVTVRPSGFERAEPDQPPCPVVVVESTRTKAACPESIGFEPTLSERPQLSEARAVVSGGRPLGARFFDVLGPLADACSAGLGATRALCDTGHVPGDLQVGQTGKVVAPDLYFAIGISGSVQHIAGMRGAKTIVAINNDPEAPIFSHADYGIVGDLWQVVPALVIAIRHSSSASER